MIIMKIVIVAKKIKHSIFSKCRFKRFCSDRIEKYENYSQFLQNSQFRPSSGKN